MQYQTYEVRLYKNGDKIWYQNEKLHREDGPAIECAHGTKQWCQNGRLHREDGPACEFANGDKEWYQNGKRHREDGPAIECVHGTSFWYLNDRKFTKEEFDKEISKKPSCSGKIVEVDGKKYKLQEL